MKFAQICYGRQNTSGSVLWDNLPEFLREIYYLKVYRPVFKEARLFSAEGVISYLPFKENEKNKALLEKYMQKELCRLKAEGSEFFSVKENMPVPEEFKITTGKSLICMLSNYLVSRSCVKRHKSFEEADIAVIDGENSLTDILLNVISPKATKIWLYTLRYDYIKPLLEDIFAQTGLCVGVCSSLNSYLLKNADIVINLSKDGEYFGSLSKNAVYIDIADDRNNTNRLMRLRKDVYVMRDFKIDFENKSLNPQCAETALCVINKSFREMIFSTVTPERLKNAAECVNSFNLRPF